jgi:exopolysaccharide biosynthesis polyprenyl glycosylphosphotransferase
MNVQRTSTDHDKRFDVQAKTKAPFQMSDFGITTLLNPTANIASQGRVVRRNKSSGLGKPGAFTVKRGFDIVVASLLIVLLSPLLVATALAVKLTSKGPVFFAQRRWGKGNVPFLLYKFRSMHVDLQDRSGIAHTVKNDPRVTAVGRFLRRTSIDELPQLFNVLLGDMSLVGPRAHVLGMHAAGVRYEDLVPEYFARHAVRPGITGLAQVRGLRGEVTDAAHARARVNADLEYIRTFSVLRDIRIMLATIPAVITGKAAF